MGDQKTDRRHKTPHARSLRHSVVQLANPDFNGDTPVNILDFLDFLDLMHSGQVAE